MTKLPVARKIREFLDEQNIPVQAFERKAGLKLNAVQNILSGRSQNPQMSTIVAIANALGCSLDDLTGGSIDKKIPQESKEIMLSNRTLLTDIFAYLKDHLVTEDIERGSHQIFEAIQEIYLFSEKNNEGVLDERFAQWWLERAKLN